MSDMAPILLPRTLDGGRPNTDAAGIFYISAIIVYTLVLAGELCMLYQHRSAFCVRIRGLPIIFASVCALQIYLIIVLLVYPLNGTWPCAAEFWVMSLFFPTGMAIFQSCNARVLKVYESQRRLQKDFLEGARKRRVVYTPRGLCEAWLALDAAAKVNVGTYIGLILSFIPTITVFFGSRRFHASYGFFGPVVDSRYCRQGGEWIPSIFMHLFWTAIVGPWILWKIRKVNDVHSWAWQTRLAILSGLPGTPLWVAFTYTDISGMLSINRFFPTAGWFIPTLIICQQVLIVIPLREALRKSSPTSKEIYSEASDAVSLAPSEKSLDRISSTSKEFKAKPSMQALEFSIEYDIEKLIEWTAAFEFTAENTIFLRETRNFKKKWSSLRTETAAQRQQMHNEASLIYFALVDPFTAETPINIEYKILKKLQGHFEGKQYDPYMPYSRSSTPTDSTTFIARENIVCPWDVILDRPGSSASSIISASSVTSARSEVAGDFTDKVFDAAIESIKYLVFTNTWPRYVEFVHDRDYY